MKYINKKTGAPVDAIQFTGPGSVQRIERDFACRIEYYPNKALLIADGTRLKRGQYAVLAMCSIVGMDQADFDDKHEKDEIQGELFPESAGA